MPIDIDGAVISDDGIYRYRLNRCWPDGIGQSVFVMLNPSTADASINDPTIRRCIGFARRWGRRGLVVVNLFALRATNPDALRSAADPVGPLNQAHVLEVLKDAEEIVCGWGAFPFARQQAKIMQRWIEIAGRIPQCLGTTKAGHPRHPLYLSNDAPLRQWSSC